MKFSLINILSYLSFLLIGQLSFSQENENFTLLEKSFSYNSQIRFDDLGYAWITGNDGLYKYNGVHFSLIPYANIFNKEVAKNERYRFEKDTEGNFWLSNYSGDLVRLDKKNKFTSFNSKFSSPQSHTIITAIKAKENEIWFGSDNGALYKHTLNASKVDSIIALPKTGNLDQRILNIEFIGPNAYWISSNKGKIYIYSPNENKLKEVTNILNGLSESIFLTKDKSDNLWIATETQGIFCYNLKNKTFKRYNQFYESPSNTKQPVFTNIFSDSNDDIWLSSDGDGLFRIKQTEDSIKRFLNEEINKFSIASNTINEIIEDDYKNLWIVAKDGAISIYSNNHNNGIKYYNGREDNTPTKVSSILKSSDGSLWLGTDGNGITRVFPENSKIQYTNSKKGNQFFEGKYIQSLLEDSNGNIWASTYQNGIWLYDKDINRFEKIKTPHSSNNQLAHINVLFLDSKNRIWASSKMGITIFSKDYEQLAFFENNTNGLMGNLADAISKDEFNNIWVSMSGGGLYKFQENPDNLNASYFNKHDYYKKDTDDLANYDIHSITSDYNGNLWILCASGFIIKYNLENDSFKSFLNEPYFKGINISATLFEDKENLWFSSTSGIYHYKIITDKLIPYYNTDGLQGDEFRKRSAFIDTQGILYFGGKYGVNAFLPSELNKKEATPKLYINEIEVLNQKHFLIIEDQLKDRIELTKNIELEPNESSFSFKFSVVGDLRHENYHYAYKLEGIDEDWIISKKEQEAIYTNVPSGTYVFRVKSGHMEGVWDIEPIALSISVKPQWWASNLAYISYVILTLLLIYSFITWFRLKNRLIKEEWQNQQNEELYAMKMNFFAKFSHEIQTPLTLVLSPIEDMIERATSNGNLLLKQRLVMINNNLSRLSRITTQLMVIRNKEMGTLKVLVSKNNIINDLKKICLSFEEQARFKNINFIQEYLKEDINIWYDKDKIEHIFYNLLSNAFKFTPREGTILLKVVKEQNDEWINIYVKDSGPGIPEEEADSIFELFYQASLGKRTVGSGIGLALTKELVDLHHGEINLNSTPGWSTSFQIKLSLKEDIFSNDEKMYIEESQLITRASEKHYKDSNDNLEVKSNNENHKKYNVLIVEDNIEMQIFLKDILSTSYRVEIAENGLQGIELARKNLPDLIISDIMMPKMDGIEMSKAIQKNKATAHIPIIILTANNSENSRILGLKSGAIEYINKPFNVQELLLKVANITSTNEKILLKLKTEMLSIPKEDIVKSKDDIFLENLVVELDKQIDNADFKLEELASTLGMSYSTIFRKCQELTGKTLVEFFRTLRMKKAAILIVEYGYSASEASFMIGFNDYRYFSKCFKTEFGKSPNKYKKEMIYRKEENPH